MAGHPTLNGAIYVTDTFEIIRVEATTLSIVELVSSGVSEEITSIRFNPVNPNFFFFSTKTNRVRYV